MTGKYSWVYILVLILILTACVTERVDKKSEDEGEAYLLREIDKVIARLPNEAGQDLFVDLQRLSAYGKFAIEPMRELLDHNIPQMRSSAAYVLGQLDAMEAMDDLIECLKDEDKLVRYESARALLEIGAWKSSVPVLIEGLDDETPYIRYLCHQTLEFKIGQDFGYQYDGPRDARLDAIKRIRDWWDVQPKSNDPKDNLAAG